MATMRYLFLLSLFVHLSVQLPRPESAIRLRPRDHPISYYTCPLTKGGGGSQTSGAGNSIDNLRQKYLFPITVGGQTLNVELDTGSSDTWIIQTGFECFDTFSSNLLTFIGLEAEELCKFGPSYTPGPEFVPSTSIYELSCYGGGTRCVMGPLGNADVTIAGLTVPQQLIGAPKESSYHVVGDSIQSGIIGMAFHNLTSAFDENLNSITYRPIMETLFEVATFDPPLAKQFSLALSRDESFDGNGGILTLGGIPDLNNPAINASDSYTYAPWQFLASLSTSEYSFYSILVDGIVIGSDTVDLGFQIVIDSGANAFQVTPQMEKVINSLWSSPVDSDGFLACDAVLTEPIGVAIGGATYYIDSVDLKTQYDDGTCGTLVSAGDIDQNIFLMGDPLLRNTLAVFDWENQIMAFYARQYYQS